MFIYVHIPFCDQKCSYCRFASIGSLQKLQIETYVQSLCDEINSSQGDTQSSTAKTLYFGGGTPGVLSENQLNKIITSVKNKYGFSEKIEINLETTPFNVTPENILSWEKLGINRISMGVQTLNNQALEEIQRGNKGNILNALKNLESSKIKNISIDFILGLPYVVKGEILGDIKYIFKKYSNITHVSVYMLEEYYEPDMIIESKYDNVTYPDNWKNMGLQEDEFEEEYTNIKNYLQSEGYNQYEISNYAKKGFECKHNQSYWNHGEVFAFGLGAYGYREKTRYRNSDNFVDYYGRKNIISEPNTVEGIFLESVMFALRTGGINGDIEKKLDRKKIKYFLDEKYLMRKDKILQLTDKGVPVMDYILREII
ncbi:MAG: radical SAM family heme chaperone HemW [Candidatus Gracilibacteria bacterium]|nr:radical SAM family heme chaperone HemW [Candidatus Gracilibacteria bacterium]